MIVGVDIGGTKIAVAAVDESGRVHERRQAPTPAREGAAAILDEVARLVRGIPLPAGAVVDACGVGSAGAFDPSGRVVHSTAHLAGWLGAEVADELGARLGSPVVVVNDVHAAAFGEYWHGDVGEDESLLVVAVGTGIGGAHIARGRVTRGCLGLAGSVGHVRVPGAPHRRCSCGGDDHIESYASGPGIEQSYAEASGRHAPLVEIGRRAGDGDPVAARVISTAAAQLGESLAGAVVVLNPARVVLAGGAANLAELFLAPFAAALRAELSPPFSGLRVGMARRGDAAIIGAAQLARRVLHGGSLDEYVI